MYKRLSNKIYNRGGTNCEILSLERNVIILTSRNIHELRADLRSTYEIDGRFAVPERQAGLKNVLAARQLLPEENSARKYVTFCDPGALRLMSLDESHLRNHIRNMPLKRQFLAVSFVTAVRRMGEWKRDEWAIESEREKIRQSHSIYLVTYVDLYREISVSPVLFFILFSNEFLDHGIMLWLQFFKILFFK